MCFFSILLDKLKKYNAKILFLDIFKTNFDNSDFLVEEFLEGDYRKFNSNQFFINTDETKILNDFSLWTYEFTGHKLMVVDLQGIQRVKGGKKYFYLTDPAINSIDLSFGATDMGEQGMMGCLYTFSLSRNDLNSKYN